MHKTKRRHIILISVLSSILLLPVLANTTKKLSTITIPNTRKESSISFTDAGNNFQGKFIRKLHPIPKGHKIRLQDSTTTCYTQLKGRYFNPTRGQTLRALDDTSAKVISESIAHTDGGLYLSCENLEPTVLLGQISHTREENDYLLLAGLDIQSDQVLGIANKHTIFDTYGRSASYEPITDSKALLALDRISSHANSKSNKHITKNQKYDIITTTNIQLDNVSLTPTDITLQNDDQYDPNATAGTVQVSIPQDTQFIGDTSQNYSETILAPVILSTYEPELPANINKKLIFFVGSTGSAIYLKGPYGNPKSASVTIHLDTPAQSPTKIRYSNDGLERIL